MQSAERRQAIIVLDFGSQYSRLITRRVRECHVYSELVAATTTLAELQRNPHLDIKGFILSGGPASVYDEHAPTCDPAARRPRGAYKRAARIWPRYDRSSGGSGGRSPGFSHFRGDRWVCWRNRTSTNRSARGRAGASGRGANRARGGRTRASLARTFTGGGTVVFTSVDESWG